ncbi:hypothetical protein CABS01_01089 [Colletotrichum abscissum]|uniref:uncharacterized protein n=1 Tax=Colletotrichum abscissum TaxID=1671311 RepID=UPI0027D4C411|nr:uncharacterized protein CABS01_01089 [Colletotrichum abscissum]KAK1505621.1 hypothetical protein CABS01_01089 [Colletotrichum abscissum]
MLLLPLCFPRMCTSHPLLYGFGFVLDSSILVSLQSTILAYLVRPPVPPSSRGLCMSKRCQPEVRGPSCPFESISRRPGGGGGGRKTTRRPAPTLNGINGTNGDGTTTEPTATPNWRFCVPFLVGGIRGREEFVWRIQPLYVRIGPFPAEVWANNAYHGRTRQPKYSQYGEFFRDIEEYAYASVLCET